MRQGGSKLPEASIAVVGGGLFRMSLAWELASLDRSVAPRTRPVTAKGIAHVP